ncbi:MAG: PD40 domain-containing protein [Planctomycetes bacterium]|nr:PD40 domain-containing protein [Planctomycetota bacterium]
MGNFGKNLVIALCLVSAGFLIAWLRFRPHLGTEGRFTDGVQEYAVITSEPLRYALWEEALPLEGLTEGDSPEFDPCLSPDGRWLVFAVGERGLGTDLWIAEMIDGQAQNARPLSELNSGMDELAPAFGHGALYFASNREGGMGGLDLWRAPFGNSRFGTVEHLAEALQSVADDTDPAPIEGSKALLFASNRRVDNPDPTAPRRTGYDLYEALESNVNGYRVKAIEALSTDANERDPAFTADGRTLFFASDRGAKRGSYDLYRGVRNLGEWLPPKAIEGLNDTASQRGPSPSPDGFSLVFAKQDRNAEGEPSSKLFTAKTRELFRKPGRPIGLFDVLLLLALLLLALLAWVAKRWTRMEVIYRCFLVSLVAHALLMWYFRDVIPESPPGELATQGPTFQVRLASTDRGAAESSKERGGELQAERQPENQAAEAPERIADAVAEAQREAAQAATEVALQAAPSSLPETQAPAESLPQESEASDSSSAQSILLAQQQTNEALYNAGAPQVSVIATQTPTGLATDRPSTRRPGRVTMAVSPDAPAAPNRASHMAQAIVRLEGEALPEAQENDQSQPSSTASETQDSSLALQTPSAAFDLMEGQAADLQASLPQGQWAPSDRIGPAPARNTELTQASPSRATETAAAQSSKPAGPMSLASALPTPTAFQPKRSTSSAPQGLTVNAPSAAVERMAGKAVNLETSLPQGEWTRTNRVDSAPARETALTQTAGASASQTATAQAAQPAAPTSQDTALPTPTVFQPKRATSDAPQRLALNAPTEVPLRSQSETAQQATPLGIALPKPSISLGRTSTVANLTPARFDAPDRTPDARPEAAPLARMDPLPAPEAPRSFPVAATEVPKFDHTPYQNRFGLAKEKALTELGGSAETEAAVASGLAYLANIQRPTGFWGRKKSVHEKYRQLRIGKTGLSLLAFLGAGHTHKSEGQYSPQVKRAIRYLLGKQDRRTGHFGDCAAYGHAVATYALAECFALTKDEALRGPLQRAVAHIVDKQNQNRDARFFGGWNYYYPDNEIYDSWPRVSVTSWQVMALKSARLAGLDVPQKSFDDARTFLNNSWDRRLGAYRYNSAPSRLNSDYPTLPASTPAALFALSLLGEDLTERKFRTARGYLMRRTPEVYRYDGQDAFVRQAQGNLYFWYYSSLALLRTGGNQWKRWNEGLKQTLLPAQAEDGSWEPISIYADYAGDTDQDRSYSTAMCVLSLEVYYRYFTPMLNARD